MIFLIGLDERFCFSDLGCGLGLAKWAHFEIVLEFYDFLCFAFLLRYFYDLLVELFSPFLKEYSFLLLCHEHIWWEIGKLMLKPFTFLFGHKWDAIERNIGSRW